MNHQLRLRLCMPLRFCLKLLRLRHDLLGVLTICLHAHNPLNKKHTQHIVTWPGVLVLMVLRRRATLQHTILSSTLQMVSLRRCFHVSLSMHMRLGSQVLCLGMRICLRLSVRNSLCLHQVRRTAQHSSLWN